MDAIWSVFNGKIHFHIDGDQIVVWEQDEGVEKEASYPRRYYVF